MQASKRRLAEVQGFTRRVFRVKKIGSGGEAKMVPIFFDCFDLLGQPPGARHAKCIQGPCKEDETYEGKAHPGEYAVDCFAAVVAEEN